jgi:uncharacterized protein YbjT (DUF2867 family)
MFVVAGASGRVGSVVAESLLSQGKKVRVLVRDAAKVEPLRARGAEVVALSLLDSAALARALEGAEGFFTLLPEDPSVADFHGHRQKMADTMASAVAAKRVPHTVLLSAIAAVLPDGNGPGKGLHYAENALRAAGKLTALRAPYFQENVLMNLAPAKHEGVFPNLLPSADFAIPTAATRDLGLLAARLLVEPPAKSEVIDVVGPMYSARQLAQKLGAAMGKSLQVVDVPAAMQVEMLTRVGLPLQFAEAVAELNACFASGRISPHGDRLIPVTTQVEEVLASVQR